MSYKGKEGFLRLGYEVAVDHTGRALGQTKGNPGAETDKTIVQYDKSVQSVHLEEPNVSKLFKLYIREGKVITLRRDNSSLMEAITK